MTVSRRNRIVSRGPGDFAEMPENSVMRLPFREKEKRNLGMNL